MGGDLPGPSTVTVECGTAVFGDPSRRVLVREIEVPPVPTICEGALERCDRTVGLEWESSRTFYHDEWDGKGPNVRTRNKDILLCRRCAAYHHERWDAQWEEVPRG
jgi:hypothetical protein